MTLNIEYTEDAQKALELVDDLDDVDWDKVYGELGPTVSPQAIYEKKDKKDLNLSDFRKGIRRNVEEVLMYIGDDDNGVEDVEIRDPEKQFTQDDLYAINRALNVAKVKVWNEQGRADKNRELLEEEKNKGRLYHLKKAVLG